MPRSLLRTAKESIRKLLPGRIRKHHILGGPLRGSSIVTSWHDYPGAILGTTERRLLDWFAANVTPGSTWIDVGAHYGYTAIALSRLVGPAGRVFAFEPVLSTAGCIALTRAINRLEQLAMIPLALDDSPCLKALEVPTVRGMADSTMGAQAWHERIFAASLDSMWPSLRGADSKIHGVKIDVQGMELPVLFGMQRILQEWQPLLVIEFHHGVKREHVIDYLSFCGYSTNHHPIEQGGPRGVFADDASYVFSALTAECAFSSNPSSTARS